MDININEKEMTTKNFFESFFEFEKLEENATNDIFSIPKKYLKMGTTVCRFKYRILQDWYYISIKYNNKTIIFYDLLFLNKMKDDKSLCIRFYKTIEGFEGFYNIKLSDIINFEILSEKDRIIKIVSEEGTYIFKGDSDIVGTEDYRNLLNSFKESLKSNIIETDGEILNYMLINKKLDYYIDNVDRSAWYSASVRMHINSHGEDYNISSDDVRRYQNTLIKFAKESLIEKCINGNLLISGSYLYLYDIKFQRDFSLIITFRIKECYY